MKENIWIVYDLIALIFFIVMVASGWKQGFVKTLIRFIGGLIAIYAAFAISVPLSEMIYKQFVETKIVSYVDRQLNETQILPDYALDVLEKMPDSDIFSYFNKAFGDAELSPSESSKEDSGLSGRLFQSIGGGKSAPEAITEQLIAPAALNIIRMITGIVLFALFSLLIKIVSGLLGEIVGMIPVIGPVNRFLGAVAGGIWALVIIYVVVILLYMLVSIFGGFAYLNIDILQQTQLVSLFIF